MELRLAHGREDPNEEMDDWGFTGPTLLFVESMQQMYGETYTVRFHTLAAAEDALRITGWSLWDERTLEMARHGDLIETREPGQPPRYYGDLLLAQCDALFEVTTAATQIRSASQALHEAIDPFAERFSSLRALKGELEVGEIRAKRSPS